MEVDVERGLDQGLRPAVRRELGEQNGGRILQEVDPRPRLTGGCRVARQARRVPRPVADEDDERLRLVQQVRPPTLEDKLPLCKREGHPEPEEGEQVRVALLVEDPGLQAHAVPLGDEVELPEKA